MLVASLQEYQHLLDTVAGEIRHLNGLLVLAGDGGAVIQIPAVLVHQGLEILIALGAAGRYIHLIHRHHAAAEADAQDGGRRRADDSLEKLHGIAPPSK